MNTVKLNLRGFIEDVYGLEMEDYYTGEAFNFYPEYIPVSDVELSEAKDILYKNGMEFDKDLISLVKYAKSRNYEYTYTDEYCRELEKQLEEKIITDFKKAHEFFEDEIKDFGAKGSFSVNIDWAKEEIIFKGKLTVLEAMILEVINSWGSFYFKDMAEFRSSLKPYNIGKRIELHIHWLRKTEEIYGTIHNFFKFDTQFVDYHGVMGNDDLTEEYLLAEAEMMVA